MHKYKYIYIYTHTHTHTHISNSINVRNSSIKGKKVLNRVKEILIKDTIYQKYLSVISMHTNNTPLKYIKKSQKQISYKRKHNTFPIVGIMKVKCYWTTV